MSCTFTALRSSRVAAATLSACLLCGAAFSAETSTLLESQRRDGAGPQRTKQGPQGSSAGTAAIGPEAPSHDAEARLTRMLPPRTDSPSDWHAGIEPLHYCGEPRLLSSCIPPPPCHPSSPPRPFDLIGVSGAPTCGPIYRGPCNPRTGTGDGDSLPRIHRLHDRAFDWFYKAK